MKSLLLKSFDSLGLFRYFNRYTANTATIFMLHSIVPDDRQSGCDITISLFARYLEYLKKSSYSVISLTDYIVALKDKKTIAKTVVFTIDDGYRNFYRSCYPLFREFGYPATVFLTSDFIEKRLFMWWDKIEYALTITGRAEIDLTEKGLRIFPLTNPNERDRATFAISEHCKQLPDDGRRELIQWLIEGLEVDLSGQPSGKYEPLSWDEIAEMGQNGIEFYPHSKTHPIMSRISYQQKLTELSESKRLLETRLNRPMDVFCYPNGKIEDIDADMIRALEESGYGAAVTSIPGFNNTKANNNLYMLHRFALPADYLHFKQYVSGMEFVKDRLRRMMPVRPNS